MLATLGIVAFLILLGVWEVIRTRRLACSRRGENFGTFRATFPDVPVDVLRAVYEGTQKLYEFAIADFPVRGTDTLDLIVGTPEADSSEFVLEVLTACRRQLPPQIHGHLGWAINSVAAFVAFVADCPPASSDLSPPGRARHNARE